jgi:hypothetical protein
VLLGAYCEEKSSHGKQAKYERRGMNTRWSKGPDSRPVILNAVKDLKKVSKDAVERYGPCTVGPPPSLKQLLEILRYA